MQISGEIVIDGDSASFENAAAFVYLEDVGRADAAASVLGRVKLSSAAHRQGAESRIPFAVEAPGGAVSASLAVRVHVSLDGDEDIAVRDLVSTAHNPAVEGHTIEVAVKEI